MPPAVVNESLDVVFGAGGVGDAVGGGQQESVQARAVRAVRYGVEQEALDGAEPADVHHGGFGMVEEARLFQVAFDPDDPVAHVAGVFMYIKAEGIIG